MQRSSSRFTLLFLSLGLAGLLSACQLAGPGSPGSDVTPNAVTGGEIEVTALDGPAPVAVDPASEGADPAADPAARVQPDAPATAAPEAAAEPVADPAPQPDLAAEVPATPKSEQQLACEKKRGMWSRVGKASLFICVFKTRDAGKQCTRESQCEGVCLARSGTCSPIKPLIGCNEILQDNGARVTLCID